MSGNEKTYKATGTTNRGLAEAIDELIKLRVRQALDAAALNDGALFSQRLENEHAEIIIRVIADALEERDLRRGVIVAPDVGHP